MANQDDLTITITAQGADAIKTLQGLTQNLGAVASAATGTSAAHDKTAKSAGESAKQHGLLHEVGQKVTASHKAMTEAGKGVHEGFLKMIESGKSLNGVLASVIGAGAAGGLAVGIGAIISKTIEWDDTVHDLSLRMNGNSEAASTWLSVTKQMGIASEKAMQAMKFLSKDVDGNKAALSQMGIQISDTNGKLLSQNDILAQALPYFRAHANDSDIAAKANLLFGKSGVDLLPILTAQSNLYDQLVKRGKDLGMVVGNEQAEANHKFALTLRETQYAFDAVTVTIGNELLPMIAQLANGITQWLVNGGLNYLKDSLKQVMDFLKGFVEEMTGIPLAIDSVASSIGAAQDKTAGYGDVLDTTAGQAAALKAKIEGITDSTTAQTDAIQRQIDALNNANQAIDDQITKEEQLLQAQTNEADFQDKLVTLSEQASAEQKNIAKLQKEYKNALDLGDLAKAQTIGASLTAEQQKLADNTRTVHKDTADHNRKVEGDALKEKLAGLKKAHADEIKDLNEKQKAIQKAAAEEIKIAQGKDGAVVSSYNNSQKAMVATQAATDVTLTQAEQEQAFRRSERMGTNGTNAATAWGSKFADQIKNFDWNGIGETIGAAVERGMQTQLAKQTGADKAVQSTKNSANDAGVGGIWDWLMSNSDNHIGKGIFSGKWSFASGGIVPGSIGQPRLAVVHGGEEVLTPSQRTNRGVAGGGYNITFHIYDAHDAQAIANVVERKFAQIAGNR